MKFDLSAHAKEGIVRRRISVSQIESVLEQPQQIIPNYGDKMAYQSKVRFNNGKIYLIRVIVDVNASPYRVITAYRTTKISKYWREE